MKIGFTTLVTALAATQGGQSGSSAEAIQFGFQQASAREVARNIVAIAAESTSIQPTPDYLQTQCVEVFNQDNGITFDFEGQSPAEICAEVIAEPVRERSPELRKLDSPLVIPSLEAELPFPEACNLPVRRAFQMTSECQLGHQQNSLAQAKSLFQQFHAMGHTATSAQSMCEEGMRAAIHVKLATVDVCTKAFETSPYAASST